MTNELTGPSAIPAKVLSNDRPNPEAVKETIAVVGIELKTFFEETDKGFRKMIKDVRGFVSNAESGEDIEGLRQRQAALEALIGIHNVWHAVAMAGTNPEAMDREVKRQKAMDRIKILGPSLTGLVGSFVGVLNDPSPTWRNVFIAIATLCNVTGGYAVYKDMKSTFFVPDIEERFKQRQKACADLLEEIKKKLATFLPAR